MMSWGFNRIEAIMNEASQSWRMPCREKDAATGMVPYMQSGEAMPRRQAGMIPNMPHFFPCMRRKRSWIPFLANTEMKEPMAMPSTQYQKICLSCISK